MLCSIKGVFIFRIGIGGGLETSGSLMNLKNQTISVLGNNISIVIDSPTLISCNDMKYENSRIFFCPSAHLYHRWKELLTQMLKKYSKIKVVNSRDHMSSKITSLHSFTFDCPKGSTVLAYGDRNCKINTTSHSINSESSPQECFRLVPMILEENVTIYSRKVSVKINSEWENVYLPCISPVYICGYGDRPNITNFKYINDQPVLPLRKKLIEKNNEKYIFFRDAQNDCLVDRRDEKFTDCLFISKIYNTTEFNLEVEMLNDTNKTSVCFEKKLCGRERNITNVCVQHEEDIIGLSQFQSTMSSYKKLLVGKEEYEKKQISSQREKRYLFNNLIFIMIGEAIMCVLGAVVLVFV